MKDNDYKNEKGNWVQTCVTEGCGELVERKMRQASPRCFKCKVGRLRSYHYNKKV